MVEYESAEQAEAVLIEMDRTPVGGQEVRLSLCTPGTSGRSTLAALIAAQGMVSMMHARAAKTLILKSHTAYTHQNTRLNVTGYSDIHAECQCSCQKTDVLSRVSRGELRGYQVISS